MAASTTIVPMMSGGPPTIYDSQGVAASGVILASAGIVTAVRGYNASASTRYVQLFDSSTVPADTAVPVCAPVAVAASSGFVVNLPPGSPVASCNTGIAWASSSTAATKTITGVADVWLTAVYVTP